MRTPPPELRCTGITTVFDDQVVLSRLNLTVPAGRITTLLGSSGGGKTTLTKHVVGLLEPQHGTVRIGDRDIWSCGPENLREVRKNMSVLLSGSFIFEPSLYGSATVRDNLLAVLTEKKNDSDGPGRGARVQACLEQLDLTDQADQLPEQLAARTRRRAALARALVADVPLYILDDPDSGVDAPHTGRILRAVLDAHERTGATMLVVTHDLSLARRISDHVAILANGRIVAQGAPHDLLGGVEDFYELDQRFRAADFVGVPRIEDVQRDGDERRFGLAVPDPLTMMIMVVAMITVIAVLVLAEFVLQ